MPPNLDLLPSTSFSVAWTIAADPKSTVGTTTPAPDIIDIFNFPDLRRRLLRRRLGLRFAATLRFRARSIALPLQPHARGLTTAGMASWGLARKGNSHGHLKPSSSAGVT